MGRDVQFGIVVKSDFGVSVGKRANDSSLVTGTHTSLLQNVLEFLLMGADALNRNSADSQSMLQLKAELPAYAGK